MNGLDNTKKAHLDFHKISFKLSTLGRGSGQVLSMLPFYLDDSSSEPAEIYKFIHLFSRGQPRPLVSFVFGLFKQTIQFLQEINEKKCQVHPV